MALDNFIPAIWSARILDNLHKSLVFASPAIMNRDYEGEIRDVGDQVKINAIGAVTVSSYTKNTNLSDPETLDSAQTTLLIDQAKSFNFAVDDIDRVQQKPKMMDEAMREAGYALGDTLDQYISDLWSQIGTANYIGTNASPKTDVAGGTAYEYLVDMGVLLDEANVPRTGRFIVVPPWFMGVMAKDTTHFTMATDTGESRVANGLVARAAGFDIFLSNNVDSTAGTASWKIIGGYPGAWTVAEQIVKTEAYRPEKRFADAVKGLHVYGAKVVRPDKLAVLFANRP